MKKRLHYPEFIELINSYDILCISETHLDPFDIVDVPDFVFFSLPRSQKYLRKSGGKGIYVRSSLFKFVKILSFITDYFLCLSIDKSVIHCPENLIICAIYIPPENDFDIFKTYVSEICSTNKYVILAGDFNSRISELNDFIPSDPFIFDEFDIGLESRANVDKHTLLEHLSIPLNRKSRDNKTNSHGFCLIERIRNNNLFVMNGRVGRDLNGDYTFKQKSVIDYVIATGDCFYYATDFKIVETDTLLSDGHALLNLTLNARERTARETGLCNHVVNNRPKWDSSRAIDFKNSINLTLLDSISTQLNTYPQSQATIEHITKQISKVFESASNQAFDNNSPKRRYYSPNNSPWFGTECHSARRKYHRAKRKYNELPSTYNKRILNSTSKQYKKKMHFYIDKFNHSKAKKLRSMHAKTPKQYWKFLNSLKSKTNDECAPSLNEFYKHFKNVNTDQNRDTNLLEMPTYSENQNIELNSIITESEILKCINGLNNGKSSSPNDNIINEYIKQSKGLMMPIYVKLFNSVLDTGFLPVSWLNGIIIPIYKNKGDKNLASNYRPITILSCLGKLFTSVLNARLMHYLESNNILQQNQAGFRKGYSCHDHIFTLHSIIDILRQKKKKIFCAFIDFAAAFDKVDRVCLWQKLLLNDINGKVFQVIYNMYSNIKSCISSNGTLSSYFKCETGVRQGENLSPALFAIFLNDMQSYIETHGGRGVNLVTSEDSTAWLKLLLLLYADDTIIVSDNESDFQKCLDAFNDYCLEWHLNVNVNKTKIVIFGARNLTKYHFKLGNSVISITNNYHYLGITFSSSGSFLQARKHLTQQAKKALYLLYSKASNANLPIDLTIKLFDNTVLPILTYGSEIFGFENHDLIESVHNTFLRKILNARKSTPIYMLHGELGRYPITILIQSRMIAFWSRLVNGNIDKLSYKIYSFMLNSGTNYKWIAKIKNILDSTGLTNIWLQQFNGYVPNNIHLLVKQTLIDQYIQNWNELRNRSHKGKMYLAFKTNFQFEPYLTMLTQNNAIPIFKLRTANHKLPIETGRWDGTPYEERKCPKCNRDEVGTEQHYIFRCDFFSDIRNKFIANQENHSNKDHYFNTIMNSTSKVELEKLAHFCKIIMKYFK